MSPRRDKALPFSIKTVKLKDGRTAYDLDYYKGKKYRPRLGHDNQYTLEQIYERAWQFVRAVEARLRGDRRPAVPLPPSRPGTLRDIQRLYWDEFHLKNRVDTQRPRGIIENHLLRIFPDTLLTELTYADGIAYQTQRKAEGANLGTLEREWGVFMRLLNLAEKLDWIPKNRLKACPKPEGARRERVASWEELRALQRVASPLLWRFVVVALTTGLRVGRNAAIAPNWMRREEDGWVLALPPAQTKIKGNPTRLPLNGLAVEALASHATPERVWTWSSPRAVVWHWGQACEKAHVVDLHLHDLRHTFATRLEGLWVDDSVIAELLGHARKDQTARYLHGSEGRAAKLRHAVTLLDVDYRSNGIVSRVCQLAENFKNVVGLESYKQLKTLKKAVVPLNRPDEPKSHYGATDHEENQ